MHDVQHHAQSGAAGIPSTSAQRKRCGRRSRPRGAPARASDAARAPPRSARRRLAPAGRAADVEDPHRLGAAAHRVEQLGLDLHVPDCSRAASPRTLRIEHDVLARVGGEAHAELPAPRAPSAASSSRALLDLPVELRQVGMGRVGRDVRREAVHVDVVALAVVEHPRGASRWSTADAASDCQRRLSEVGRPPSPITLTAKPEPHARAPRAGARTRRRAGSARRLRVTVADLARPRIRHRRPRSSARRSASGPPPRTENCTRPATHPSLAASTGPGASRRAQVCATSGCTWKGASKRSTATAPKKRGRCARRDRRRRARRAGTPRAPRSAGRPARPWRVVLDEQFERGATPAPSVDPPRRVDERNELEGRGDRRPRRIRAGAVRPARGRRPRRRRQTHAGAAVAEHPPHERLVGTSGCSPKEVTTTTLGRGVEARLRSVVVDEHPRTGDGRMPWSSTATDTPSAGPAPAPHGVSRARAAARRRRPARGRAARARPRPGRRIRVRAHEIGGQEHQRAAARATSITQVYGCRRAGV